MRAVSVVKRQFTRVAVWFRLSSQAVISLCSVSLSGIRRSKHWDERMASSISAAFSQLPCFGVLWISSLSASRLRGCELAWWCGRTLSLS